ncbi:MAG: SH3 domain-containing protein [bacterium]|nr:SH3 domain-containing protein [bacterium]
MLNKKLFWVILMLAMLSACTGTATEQVASVPTATLQPLLNLTPEMTATPVSTRTPLPTFTFTPSPTFTPSITPIPPSLTPTPPIIGRIQGTQRINVRNGPGEGFEVIATLTPGDGVQILGQDSAGEWYNIQLDDGTQGWISVRLVSIQPTPTAPASLTPTPDQTLIALGTPLPTAIIGGGTITPTPPRAAVSATPIGTGTALPSNITPSPTAPFIPVIPNVNVSVINQTATALAGNVSQISPPPTFTPAPNVTATSNVPVIGNPPSIATNTPDPNAVATVSSGVTPVAGSNPVVQQGVRVFALCDANPRFPAPTNLAAGSSVIVWWTWIVVANSEEAARALISAHEAAVRYEVRINDVLLDDWRDYGVPTIAQTGTSTYAKSWYVPAGTLTAGTYRVTYLATWSTAISDGTANYGPGTLNLTEQGACTFVVR